MTEPIESILTEGYRTWRRNMALGIPFIINLMALIAAVTLEALASVLLFALLIASNMSLIVILLIALFLIASILVLMLISAFFSAGAIGMAWKATDSGTASLGDVLAYGKKKAADLFIANVLVSVSVSLIGLILAGTVGASLLLHSLSLALSIAAFDLVLLIILSVILQFILAPVAYSIVLSDLSAADGISAGYRFFMDNKTAVILLMFTINGVYLGYGMITETVTSLFGAIPLVGSIINIGVSLLAAAFSLLVIQPIVTLWWVRLYSDCKKIKKDEPIAPNLEAAQPASGNPSSGPFYV